MAVICSSILPYTRQNVASNFCGYFLHVKVGIHYATLLPVPLMWLCNMLHEVESLSTSCNMLPNHITGLTTSCKQQCCMVDAHLKQHVARSTRIFYFWQHVAYKIKVTTNVAGNMLPMGLLLMPQHLLQHLPNELGQLTPLHATFTTQGRVQFIYIIIVLSQFYASVCTETNKNMIKLNEKKNGVQSVSFKLILKADVFCIVV